MTINNNHNDITQYILPIQHNISSIQYPLYLVPLQLVYDKLHNSIDILAQWTYNEWPDYYHNNINIIYEELISSLSHNLYTTDLYFILCHYYNLDNNNTIYGSISILSDDMGLLTNDEMNGITNIEIPTELQTTSKYDIVFDNVSKLHIIDYIQGRQITPCIGNLYVNKQYRNYGLAKQILLQCHYYAYNIMKYDSIYLWTDKIELSVYYNKLGYKPVKRIYSYTKHELLSMKLDLKQVYNNNNSL